jgi:thiosulfate oxidation carrier protein SoxY
MTMNERAISRRTTLRALGVLGVAGATGGLTLARPLRASAQQLGVHERVEDGLRRLFGSRMLKDGRGLVKLEAPLIAENGAVVPLACACALPGVKRLLLLVEKNPNTLAAVFDVTDAVEPNFSTRVKMGQSSNVYAVAMMGDGKVLYAQKEVKVTLGGCGG